MLLIRITVRQPRLSPWVAEVKAEVAEYGLHGICSHTENPEILRLEFAKANTKVTQKETNSSTLKYS